MGLACSQYRLIMLTKRKDDLEFRMEIIDEARIRLATASGNLAAVMASNPAAQQMMQAQLQVIQSADTVLEMEQKQLETQHQAAVTEIEGVQKIIAKNIDMSFKIFANG